MSAPTEHEKQCSININLKRKPDDRIHLHMCAYTGCDKTFNRADRLKIHLRTHTGERPFVCDYRGCIKSYARASHLKRHQEIGHLEGTQKRETLRCTEGDCSQEFTLPLSLKRHIRCQHQDKLYEFECCFPGCGKAFKKHQQLKTHEYEHSDVDPYRCMHEGCEKQYRLPSRLKRHMKVHSGYECDVEGCGVMCATWSQFRSHTKHTHPKEYVCEECGESFQSKKWLQKHSQLHQTTSDIFSCPRDGCHRTYLTMYGLKAHVRSYHEGIKYECSHPECQRKFASKQKLKIHEQIHDPNRPPVRKKPRKSAKKRSMALKLSGLTDKKKETNMEQEFSETTTDEEFLSEVRKKGKTLTPSSISDYQELQPPSEPVTQASICVRKTLIENRDISQDRRVVLVNSTIDSVKAMSIESVNATIVNTSTDRVTSKVNECVHRTILSAETTLTESVKPAIVCVKNRPPEPLNQSFVSNESMLKESVSHTVGSIESRSGASLCQTIVSDEIMETESLNQTIVSSETTTTECLKQAIVCAKTMPPESLNQSIVSNESMAIESVDHTVDNTKMSVASICKSIVSDESMQTESLNQTINSANTTMTESLIPTLVCAKTEPPESLNKSMFCDESIAKESVNDTVNSAKSTCMLVASVPQTIVSDENIETESSNQIIGVGETTVIEFVKQAIVCAKSLPSESLNQSMSNESVNQTIDCGKTISIASVHQAIVSDESTETGCLNQTIVSAETMT